MKDGHIDGVEYLKQTTDAGRVAEARMHFAAQSEARRLDGFEVWDGPRFVYRFSELPTES